MSTYFPSYLIFQFFNMNRSTLNKRPDGDSEYNFSTPEAITRFFMLPYINRDRILLGRISKGQVSQIMNTIGIDSQMLCSVIGLRPRTFLQKETDDLFCNSISENIVDLLEVYSYGYHQCNDPAVFNLWMKDAHPSLSSITPLSHCRDKMGKLEVFKEISGINETGYHEKKPE